MATGLEAELVDFTLKGEKNESSANTASKDQ